MGTKRASSLSVRRRKRGTKKYVSRPSPPFSANVWCGKTKKGNDGSMYRSTQNSNGVCTWKKIKR